MSAGDGSVGSGALGFGAGARSAATSLLQTLACDAVLLRMPAPPVADSVAEELGLGSPQFTDLTIAPALVQQNGAKTLVTVGADALETALGVSGADAVEGCCARLEFCRRERSHAAGAAGGAARDFWAGVPVPAVAGCAGAGVALAR